MQVTPLLNFDNQSLSSILLTVSPQNEVLMPQRFPQQFCLTWSRKWCTHTVLGSL